MAAVIPNTSRFQPVASRGLPGWLPLVTPLALFSLLAACLSAVIWNEPLLGVTVFLLHAVGFALVYTRLGQAVQHATNRLRHAELRYQNGPENGSVIGGLLAEALLVITSKEAALREVQDSRQTLEARLHRLREQILRAERCLSELPQSILLTDGGGNVQFVNAAAKLLRDDEGNSIEAWPELKSLIAATLDRQSATTRRTLEFTRDSLDGHSEYRARAMHVRDADGRSIGVAVQVEEVGDELRDRRRHGEFIAAVCHELKTPLTGIRGYTELLIDGDVESPEAQKETLCFINEQVDRLTRLVNNMMNLMRVETGIVKVQRQPHNLCELLKKAVTLIEPTARAKQLTLVNELSAVPQLSLVDADLFGQAVINLLSNAVKYTPAGGTITLRSRCEGDDAIIEVIDSGLGIPRDALPRLFEPFYRVPENVHAAQGTGLGLTLVKQIVANLHDGKIAVDSTVGQGSRFTLSFPMLNPAASAASIPASTSV